MDKRTSIIRIEKTRCYSVVSNECFRDPRLSARAKGIFAYIMTLPDDWKLYKKELYAHFKEGRDAINKAFTELELAGYVFKESTRDSKSNHFTGWEYTIYEKPQCFPELLKTRNSGNWDVGEPATTKDVFLENTNRREYVEKASSSQRSTDDVVIKEEKRPKTPHNAPWRGVDYSEVDIPTVSGYGDLAAIKDPVLCAISVTGDRGGYPYWVKVLNKACSEMGVGMACRVFQSCLEQIFGQTKNGELRNPAGALNVMLKENIT
jgi:hypothetical protein